MTRRYFASWISGTGVFMDYDEEANGPVQEWIAAQGDRFITGINPSNNQVLHHKASNIVLVELVPPPPPVAPPLTEEQSDKVVTNIHNKAMEIKKKKEKLAKNQK